MLAKKNGFSRSGSATLYKIDRCRFQCPSLTLKGGTRWVILLTLISVNTFVSFDLERTQIRQCNTRGKGCTVGVNQPSSAPQRPQILRPLIYAHAIWPRTTKFGILTYVERRRVCFSDISHAPSRKTTGSSAPSILEFP